MKKVLLGLLCGLFAVYLILRPRAPGVGPATGVDASKKHSINSKVVSGTPATTLLKKSAGEGEIPAECKKMWSDLLSLYLSDIQKEVTDKSSPMLDANCIRASAKDIPLAGSLDENCRKKDLTNPSLMQACQQALQFYRAQVIYFLTKNEHDPRKLETNVLINKLMALFSGMVSFKNEEDLLSQMEPMANELKDREKNMFAAYKSVAMVKIIRFMASEEKAPEKLAALEGEARKSIDELRRFDVDDEEVPAASWAIAINDKNYPQAIREIDAYLQEKPNSARAYYDKSAVFWKQNYRASALAYLERAAKLDPENSIIQETRAKFASAKAGDKIFDFNFTVNFGDF